MSAFISISKVKPVNYPRKNNNDTNELNIIKQCKILIIIEAIMGINRTYLLQWQKPKIILTNIYCLFCMCSVGYQLLKTDATTSSTKFATRNIPMIEYITFVIMTMTCCKNKLRKFYKILSSFDEMLNIQNDLAIICSSKRVLKWTLFTVICNLVEIGMTFSMSRNTVDPIILCCLLLTTMTHDLEQVFFLTLLRCVYVRILIIKAHVEKRFQECGVTNSVETTEVTKLSERVQLEISSLHEAYQILLKCAGKLNYAMNFPVCLNKYFT